MARIVSPKKESEKVDLFSPSIYDTKAWKLNSCMPIKKNMMPVAMILKTSMVTLYVI